MSVEKAKNYYADRTAPRKMNCCESVGYAFRDQIPLRGAELESFKNFGGGRAPGGYCGAIYAAKRLLEVSGAHEKAKAAEAAITQAAGSVKCREIKALKKTNCLTCIELSAQAVADTVRLKN